MENSLREDLISLFVGWFLSGGVCIVTLSLYWFGIFGDKWVFELTLLIVIDFGVLGFFVVLTLVITFLCRFKIVRK